jgi:hypothetical protein
MRAPKCAASQKRYARLCGGTFTSQRQPAMRHCGCVFTYCSPTTCAVIMQAICESGRSNTGRDSMQVLALAIRQ